MYASERGRWECRLGLTCLDPTMHSLQAKSTKPHKTFRGGENTVPIQEGRADVPLYPDDLLPKIQQILAILAALDRRYETDCYRQQNWSGPRVIKSSSPGRLAADSQSQPRA